MRCMERIRADGLLIAASTPTCCVDSITSRIVTALNLNAGKCHDLLSECRYTYGIRVNRMPPVCGRAFVLLTCQTQLAELRATLHKPALIERIRPHHAGHLVNQLKNYAVLVDPLPRVERSSDPDNDFLLAAAQIGRAD
jgi:hypothetical protein